MADIGDWLELTHRDALPGRASQTPRTKKVLASGTRIRHRLRNKLIRLEVEGITDDQLVGLSARQSSKFDETLSRFIFARQDKRLLVRHTFHQAKWRRHDVHLPIADENVTIAPKGPDTFIFVRVLMVCI